MKPLDTPEGDPPASPFVPGEEWIEALEAQTTQRLIEGAEHLAARLTFGLAYDGHPNDAYYVRALVQDVLSDTAVGVLRWDPQTKTLDRHVRDAVRVRAHHDRVHAHRFPRTSLDIHDAGSTTLAEVEAALSEQRDNPSADDLARADAALARIRRRAADDPLVLAMLDAFAVGAITKDEVMAETGMSSSDYKNAHRRLARLAPHSQNSQIRVRTRERGA